MHQTSLAPPHVSQVAPQTCHSYGIVYIRSPIALPPQCNIPQARLRQEVEVVVMTLSSLSRNEEFPSTIRSVLVSKKCRGSLCTPLREHRRAPATFLPLSRPCASPPRWSSRCRRWSQRFSCRWNGLVGRCCKILPPEARHQRGIDTALDVGFMVVCVEEEEDDIKLH